MRSKLCLLIIVALATAGVCRAQQWVGTWASAPQLTETRNLPPAPGLAHGTLRQTVHVSIGGARLRVRFSNAFGDGPVTMSLVHLALSAGGSSIQLQSEKALTFGGNASVTIGAGEMIFSDPIDFDLAPLSDLVVTIHFNDVPHDVTGHPGARCTTYLQSGEAVSAPELPAAAKTNHWYILSGVDVLAAPSAAAIAILGDSITDGRGSTTDQNGRWPDDLSRRLQATAGMSDIAVLNQGIGGNRVLHDGLGPKGVGRVQRDVLEQSGVRWMIVLEGVNDIGTSGPDEKQQVAADLIAAYQQMISAAHARHIRVYGVTILPIDGSFYFTPAHEADRQTVNRWIRSSGAFDAVMDLDQAVRDPQRPTHLAPAADSGDHLHPNDAGYRLMAGAIDLQLFAK
jgi:lysophospholipase L1-like esterase